MTDKEKAMLDEERRKAEERAKKRKAEEIVADYLERREQRRTRENQWTLCARFLGGQQYCDVRENGEVAEEEKRFYWQTRRVFNRIAPTVDARMAKLVKTVPELRVRAFSAEEGDVQAANLATAILQSVKEKIDLTAELERGTFWAEVCGSVFYKVAWDETAGKQVGTDENGAPICEGEICLSVVPPFEIFPLRMDAEKLEDVESVIHAKAVSAAYIQEKFGVCVKGERMETESFGGGKEKLVIDNAVLLIERYTLPHGQDVDGKLEIVAGGELLYEGKLPYLNGEGGTRTLPFVRQDCLRAPGCFFGRGVVEGLIPLQRAYNAVRNRKHEFLNRATFGVLTVEDGSLDTEELAEEGLSPGRVLVYRQGGTPPKFLDGGQLPTQFAEEEEWLEKEFSVLSGVSDLSQSSRPANVTSATGLQLLLSQDNSRLQNSVSALEQATKEIGRHILRLYKQFAGTARLAMVTGKDKRTQIYYFNASDLRASDVTFESEAIVSVEERRETLLRLYQAGILTGEDGNVPAAHKNAVLEAFGLPALETAQSVAALHTQKAAQENLNLRQREVAADEFDDHDLHAEEHMKYLLTLGLRQKDEQEEKQRVLRHLKEHEKYRKKEGNE